MKKTQLTQQGFLKLQNELKELLEVKKPQAIERLSRARAMGDLSENSEYTAAKENLDFIENRIFELEEILKKVEVANSPKDNKTVELGETIIVESNGKKQTFTIVGDYEAKPMEGKISASSPIGKGLLGKKINDEVLIETPAGKVTFKILQIKK